MFSQISTEAARQLIRERTPVILDVRDPVAYRDARIPNAIHVTLSTIQAALKRFGRDAPLLIYCYRGHASKDFAELFSDFGFREVYSLEGGFQAWHAGHAEIERPVAAPPVVNTDPATDWLLDEGGNPDDVNAPLADGSLPLIKACQQGRSEIVEKLIESGADCASSIDAYGNDALWAACYSGDLRTIAALVDARLDLNRRNPSGATALIYAASAGKTEVVEFLLELGADPALKTEDDFTALELAANLDILKRLRRATRSAA
ncbi:ankyrin repeat domain-containing protein [Methylomagnum sp.]